MEERALRILLVNSSDVGGGAQKVGWDLFQSYREQGHKAWLAVGSKERPHAHVMAIPDMANSGQRHRRRELVRHRYLHGQKPWLNGLAGVLASPLRTVKTQLGLEDYCFPGSHQLLQNLPQGPDIIHCHNLHANYFDLRLLSPWSHQFPVVMTLHDAWLLSGHCAHSFDCARWQTGCGRCPDLEIPPRTQRDATAYNWRRKRRIFQRSRLHVATPSQWLMDKVTQSMLSHAIVEAKVIHGGVNLDHFRSGLREAARHQLGLPSDCNVLLFTAKNTRVNVWKDFRTLRAAVAQIPNQGHRTIFLVLGDEGPTERVGPGEIRFIPFQEDPRIVARYYQAADLYIHAARADTFPTVVLEALACGTPVVATAVGGIPEQVQGLSIPAFQSADPIARLNRHSLGSATGILVPPGDAATMASAIVVLLSHSEWRRQLGQNAAEIAQQRFDLRRQVKDYMTWYRQILGRRQNVK